MAKHLLPPSNKVNRIKFNAIFYSFFNRFNRVLIDECVFSQLNYGSLHCFWRNWMHIVNKMRNFSLKEIHIFNGKFAEALNVPFFLRFTSVNSCFFNQRSKTVDRINKIEYFLSYQIIFYSKVQTLI